MAITNTPLNETSKPSRWNKFKTKYPKLVKTIKIIGGITAIIAITAAAAITGTVLGAAVTITASIIIAKASLISVSVPTLIYIIVFGTAISGITSAIIGAKKGTAIVFNKNTINCNEEINTANLNNESLPNATTFNSENVNLLNENLRPSLPTETQITPKL